MYLGLLLRIKRDREAKEAPKVAEEGSKCVSTKSTTKISTAVAAKANHEPKKFTAKSKERLAKLTSNNQPPPPGSDEEARKNALLIRIKKEREKKNEVKAVKAKAAREETCGRGEGGRRCCFDEDRPTGQAQSSEAGG